MVDIKEIQNLTYKNSKGIKYLRELFDKKIKKAAKHGDASTYISLPLLFKDTNVFLSTAREYEKNGYKVEVCFEHWRYDGIDVRIVNGVEIFWEKPI